MNVQHDRIESESFAVHLRRLRKRRGLTLREVAAAVGVTAPAVSGWEHGRSKPRRRFRLALATLLEAPGWELFSELQQDQASPALCTALEESGSQANSEEIKIWRERSLPETIMYAKEQIAQAAGTTADRVTITIAL